MATNVDAVNKLIEAGRKPEGLYLQIINIEAISSEDYMLNQSIFGDLTDEQARELAALLDLWGVGVREGSA